MMYLCIVTPHPKWSFICMVALKMSSYTHSIAQQSRVNDVEKSCRHFRNVWLQFREFQPFKAAYETYGSGSCLKLRPRFTHSWSKAELDQTIRRQAKPDKCEAEAEARADASCFKNVLCSCMIRFAIFPLWCKGLMGHRKIRN